MVDTTEQTIVDFLNSARTASFATDNSTCGTCGAAVEYRPSVLFHVGQSWEVWLPFCIKCQPSAPLLTYDA
jgi:hypothetical protein